MPCSCTDYGPIYSTIVKKSLQSDVWKSLNLILLQVLIRELPQQQAKLSE